MLHIIRLPIRRLSHFDLSSFNKVQNNNDDAWIETFASLFDQILDRFFF